MKLTIRYMDRSVFRGVFGSPGRIIEPREPNAVSEPDGRRMCGTCMPEFVNKICASHFASRMLVVLESLQRYRANQPSQGSASMCSRPRVLILDDDPFHLDIYRMLVQTAGFEPIPILVRFSGPDPLPDSKIDIVLLDYRLNSVKTAPEIAQELHFKFPEAPIILLSDLWSAPSDVAPFITNFVRKGQPAVLTATLRSHFSNPPADD